MKIKYLYLKLGGSIITDKNKPFTPKDSVIKRLSIEIKKSYDFLKKNQQNTYRIIIGHGSGSFGHFVAKKYKLKEGKNKITGVSLIKDESAVLKLNRIILESLEKENIPVLPISPLSFMNYNSKEEKFELYSKPILNALKNNIIPLVYGDNILDDAGNFYLCSTETIFLELSRLFKPFKMIFVTDTPVYYVDKETNKKIFMKKFNPKDIQRIQQNISGYKFDVTGGLLQKLKALIILSKKYKSEIKLIDGSIRNNLMNEIIKNTGVGTVINYK